MLATTPENLVLASSQLCDRDELPLLPRKNVPQVLENHSTHIRGSQPNTRTCFNNWPYVDSEFAAKLPRLRHLPTKDGNELDAPQSLLVAFTIVLIFLMLLEDLVEFISDHDRKWVFPPSHLKARRLICR